MNSWFKKVQKHSFFNKTKESKKTELKVLLLGSSETLKAKFLKQAHSKYGSFYSDNDKQNLKLVVYQKLFTSLQTVLRFMDSLKISYESAENEELAKTIKTKDYESIIESGLLTFTWDEELTCIKELWQDKGVQVAYNRHTEYYLSESGSYFLSNAHRIIDPNYMPTEEDIIWCQMDCFQYLFALNDIITIKIVHKRYRTEREQWMKYFEDVNTVIFIVDLCDYDRMSIGDEDQNLLKEQLAFFQQIVKYPCFQNSFFTLAFNNTEGFRKKITETDSQLSDHFPEYQGSSKDFEASKNFILKMFLDLEPDPNDNMIHSIFVDADEEYVHKVFEDAVNLKKNNSKTNTDQIGALSN